MTRNCSGPVSPPAADLWLFQLSVATSSSAGSSARAPTHQLLDLSMVGSPSMTFGGLAGRASPPKKRAIDQLSEVGIDRSEIAQRIVEVSDQVAIAANIEANCDILGGFQAATRARRCRAWPGELRACRIGPKHGASSSRRRPEKCLAARPMATGVKFQIGFVHDRGGLQAVGAPC